METNIQKKSQVLRELEIFVSEEELMKAFDDAYHAIRPKLALPGFRSGKAPISLIKKMHGDAIEGDALEKMAQEKFRDAVTEHKLEPIGTPVMTDLHRHHGEGAHFKISYEVKPEITLADYEGTEVERPIYTVTDADVEDRVHYLRFNYSTREPIQKIENDETIVGLSFTDMSDPAAPKTESTTVYLHDPEIVPELRTALIGKSVGDAFEIELPQTIDGEKKMLPVSITVDSAEKVILAEVNEEFCKKISRDKAATELEVRMLVREELQLNADRRSREAMESNMVNALLAKHDFQVPRTFTYAILDAMLKEAHEDNKRRGYPENYNIDEEQFRTAGWNNAELRAKWLLLRDKLVEAMSIEATDEEIEALAVKDAEAYGIPSENLVKYYLTNDEVKERIRSEKLVEELMKRFQITDKIVEREEKK